MLRAIFVAKPRSILQILQMEMILLNISHGLCGFISFPKMSFPRFSENKIDFIRLSMRCQVSSQRKIKVKFEVESDFWDARCDRLIPKIPCS